MESKTKSMKYKLKNKMKNSKTRHQSISIGRVIWVKSLEMQNRG